MGVAGDGCIDRHKACADPGNSVFFFRHQRISKRSGSVPVFLRKQTASYAFPGVGSRPPVSPSGSAHG